MGDEFDPMRWNEAKEGQPVSCLQFAPEGFFPFGYGGHSCIGKQLAQLACLIIIARTVARFVVLPKDGSAPSTFNTTNSEQILGFTEAIGGVHVNLRERPEGPRPTLATSAATPSVASSAVSSAVPTGTTERNRKLGWPEIRKHTSRESLWVVLRGKVLDITKFVTAHPGGDKILLRQGGKDVSKLFFDMINHSTAAAKMTEEYVIGEVAGDAKL